MPLKALEHRYFNAREHDVVKEIMDYTNGRGVDVAIEAAGHPATLQNALASLYRGES